MTSATLEAPDLAVKERVDALVGELMNSPGGPASAINNHYPGEKLESARRPLLEKAENRIRTLIDKEGIETVEQRKINFKLHHNLDMDMSLGNRPAAAVAATVAKAAPADTAKALTSQEEAIFRKLDAAIEASPAFRQVKDSYKAKIRAQKDATMAEVNRLGGPEQFLKDEVKIQIRPVAKGAPLLGFTVEHINVPAAAPTLSTAEPAAEAAVKLSPRDRAINAFVSAEQTKIANEFQSGAGNKDFLDPDKLTAHLEKTRLAAEQLFGEDGKLLPLSEAQANRLAEVSKSAEEYARDSRFAHFPEEERATMAKNYVGQQKRDLHIHVLQNYDKDGNMLVEGQAVSQEAQLVEGLKKEAAVANAGVVQAEKENAAYIQRVTENKARAAIPKTPAKSSSWESMLNRAKKNLSGEEMGLVRSCGLGVAAFVAVDGLVQSLFPKAEITVNNGAPTEDRSRSRNRGILTLATGLGIGAATVFI